jgi:phosphatidylserine/phosphatidylglycerophosphate/cardiolipin synthase-like enzyme
MDESLGEHLAWRRRTMERVLCGEALAAEIRALCDKARRRIWLAVPFIGGVSTVRRLLGRAWLDRDDVDLRLLVDIEERSCLDLKSLRLLAERGKVRSLPWLHAKIYMADDTAVITSANLTEMAFSRRVEVGIKLGYDETVELAAVYDTWWRDSMPVPEILTGRIPEILSGLRKETGDESREGGGV